MQGRAGSAPFGYRFWRSPPSRLGRNDLVASDNTFSFPRRVFCARVLLFGFAHPYRRVAERRETYGCLRGTRGPARDAAGQALRRRLASHNAGRPPPGAHTVAVLGSGAALTSPDLRPDRLRAPRVRVVVPGWRLSVPPGANGCEPRRRTPRLAPPSGCLRTTPFDEQGWECFYCGPK